MKLNISKKSSANFLTKIILIVSVITIAFIAPIESSQKVSADQFDTQINNLQKSIKAAQNLADQLATQALTLQSAIAGLQNQQAILQTQIDLSLAQYNQLVAQIADTEKKIKDNQDALGQTIADLYVDQKISPLEMLASSKNISDYLDKQEYRNSVRDQLASKIKDIKDLKSQLEKQKTDVQAVLDKQNAEKTSLLASQNQQQSLLNQTNGEEAAYHNLVASNQQKLSDVSAQQRAYYQSLQGSSGGASSGVYGSFQYSNLTPSNGSGGCSGGYPYCGPQDTSIDPWGLFNRECVSYVAWALQDKYGKYVGNFNGQGNAYQWPSSAPAFSGATRVYEPQVGDAVVLPQSGRFAPLGHLMIVDGVDGDTLHVSQYNFYGTGQYSTMDIKNSGIILLRFPNN